MNENNLYLEKHFVSTVHSLHSLQADGIVESLSAVQEKILYYFLPIFVIWDKISALCFSTCSIALFWLIPKGSGIPLRTDFPYVVTVVIVLHKSSKSIIHLFKYVVTL